MPFTHTLRGLGPIQQPTSHHSSSRAMLSRYRWYIDQLARREPRSLDALERVLENPPPAPSSHELAMVELSLPATPRARLILSEHTPLSRTASFHRACLSLAKL